MIDNTFREKLGKIVQFIFCNEGEFITRFIKEPFTSQLSDSHKSIEKVSSIDLINVLLSNSRTFIRIRYIYDNDEKDYLSFEEKGFFLDSNEVFDWVNEKTKNK